MDFFDFLKLNNFIKEIGCSLNSQHLYQTTP